MAGRPRKVVDLQVAKMGKAEKEQRVNAEKKLKLDRTQLVAPEWLDDVGKAEFIRVATEAASIDLWDNLDLGILAIYANAYSSYVEVTEKIQEEGYLGTRSSRYDEYYTVHPLVAIQEKYAKQIMQASSKLGLATTDRLKLIVPVKEEKEINRYLKYLDG